jgi:hypothetical protein
VLRVSIMRPIPRANREEVTYNGWIRKGNMHALDGNKAGSRAQDWGSESYAGYGTETNGIEVLLQFYYSQWHFIRFSDLSWRVLYSQFPPPPSAA